MSRAAFQVGFTRGLLTAGGLGGYANADVGGDPSNVNGGSGGNSGAISLTVNPLEGLVTFRDIDLISGAGAETAFSRLFFTESPTAPFAHFAATGALGGNGSSRNIPRGGDGGQGGAAGAITINGSLQPLPVSFFPVGGINMPGDILGFDGGDPPTFSNDTFGDFVIGTTIQAEDGLGNALYRVRVDETGTALVGGSGGFPGNGFGIFILSPGAPGAKGASATAVGLPLQ